jgi:hypothetical protein
MDCCATKCMFAWQTQALRDALRALFSEPRLPANPYYFLSSVLGAYVDQSPLWKAADGAVLGRVGVDAEDDGFPLVLHAGSALCCHTGTPHAVGLPHVLRLVNKHGEAHLKICENTNCWWLIQWLF